MSTDYDKLRLDIQKENSQLCAELDAKIQEAFNLLGPESERNKEDYQYLREFSEKHNQTKAELERKKIDLLDELFETYYKDNKGVPQ